MKNYNFSHRLVWDLLLACGPIEAMLEVYKGAAPCDGEYWQNAVKKFIEAQMVLQADENRVE